MVILHTGELGAFGIISIMSKKLSYNHVVRILLFVAIAYAGTQMVPLLMGKKQHDFKTYYYATKAHQQGLDPYDIQSLRITSGDAALRLPFVYPPYCLTLFEPFASFKYNLAYYLFILAKLAAISGLIIVWLRIVPGSTNDYWAFIVTICLGYRCAILRDLKAGNVSSFEQLLLWIGILLLLSHKSWAGGLGILLSSAFKLLPAMLIPLTTIIGRSWRSFIITIMLCISGLAGYLYLYSQQKDLWLRFFLIASGLDERGNINPSSLAFIRDMADTIGCGYGVVYPVYALLGCVILCAWSWAFWQTRRSQDCYPMLYLTIMVYVILAPRMKDYTLIIALLPTLHTISAVLRSRWMSVIACVLLWIPLFTYQSLALPVLVFALLLLWINETRNLPSKMMELTLNPLRVFREANL